MLIVGHIRTYHQVYDTGNKQTQSSHNGGQDKAQRNAQPTTKSRDNKQTQSSHDGGQDKAQRHAQPTTKSRDKNNQTNSVLP